MKTLPSSPRKNRRQRAAVVVQVAISLSMMLGFAALTIDLGYVYVARTEMQDAVDAAALAGASGVLEGEAEVLARVLEYAAYHKVAGDTVNSSEVTTTIGTWEGGRQTFTPADGSEPVTPNAVRVVGRKTNMGLFFANLFGISSIDIPQDGIAISSSGECAGIWGIDGITGSGNITTDSYDSTDGAYGVGNRNANGDICSCRDLAINGAVDVYGDAIYGDGYDFTTNGNSYNVYGIVDSGECDYTPPAFDINEVMINNDNNLIGLTDDGNSPFQGMTSKLFLTGTDNLTLAPGTYYFQSVMITGQATLTITGPTKIYVLGNANFSGDGITNATQDPADLEIYVAGNTVTLSGTAGFYGTVIAPDADLNLTGITDYYGTAYVSNLNMTGTMNLHIDEEIVRNLFGIDPTAPILVR